MRKRKHGDHEVCGCCGQDIEWHGRAHGWIDRGGNRPCVSYFVKGELYDPPKGAKHRPGRGR